MVLTKEDAARELWQKKVIEADAYLSDIAPELCGDCPDFFPKEIIEKNVIEKIFNANFELDWIPKGLRLRDLKEDPRLFYQAKIISDSKENRGESSDSSVKTKQRTSPYAHMDLPQNGNHGGYERYVKSYWWGSQKFASEPVGGYWVLWCPEVYCLNQPASVQKGPCEVFAEKCFNFAGKNGGFPHIAELVYLFLLHAYRAKNYIEDDNFIGNFIRSGTQLVSGNDFNKNFKLSDLLLCAGWKLSRVSENSDIKIMLHIDDSPFYSAIKNVGIVPFIKLDFKK